MIDVSSSNGQWRVVLNRPDKANALSRDMLQAIAEIAKTANADPALCSFVITGAGERVFCAGADVDSATDMFAFTRDKVWVDASQAIADLPCLTIAALNGTLAGGGFALALACDLRLATPNAKFFYPVLKRGFLPQPADVLRLSALIGPSQAKMILMAGQKIDADHALRIRLIDMILPLGDFETQIAALTSGPAAAKPESSAAIKRLFKEDMTADELEECYAAAYYGDAKAISKITGR